MSNIDGWNNINEWVSLEERNEQILDSLEVVDDPYLATMPDDWTILDYVRKVVDKHHIALDTSLHWARLIMAEMNNPEGNIADAFFWLESALEMVTANPAQKILLVSTFTRETLEKIGDGKYKDFIALPNVGFLSLQQDDDSDVPSPRIHPIDDINAKQKLTATISANGANVIRFLQHNLEPSKFTHDPYNPEWEREKQNLEKSLKKAQKSFPALESIEQMLDFVLGVDTNLPEVMKGKKIDGVYVDVDGTLLTQDNQLNQSVIDRLKAYEAEGKDITVWTGGNVTEKKQQLSKLWIDWPVVSKYDYAGAIAEIVIDDLDQSRFITQSKICPQLFINVDEIIGGESG